MECSPAGGLARVKGVFAGMNSPYLPEEAGKARYCEDTGFARMAEGPVYRFDAFDLQPVLVGPWIRGEKKNCLRVCNSGENHDTLEFEVLCGENIKFLHPGSADRH